MERFIIVGAGLFGSMAARALADDGHDVVVIDDRAPNACSKAAGCLIKPSWLMGMEPEKRVLGLTFLRNTYPMVDLDFRVLITGVTVQIAHLPPEAVLLKDDQIVRAKVTRVQNGAVVADEQLYTGTVILAAGVGCRELWPAIRVEGLMGVSLVFPGEVCVPQFHVWAPYKQAVCVNSPRGVWFGNGGSIKPENWDHEKRVGQAKEQAAKFFGLDSDPIVQVGARPSTPGHPGLLQQLDSELWINTGGAKSGAVLAGAHAMMLRLAYAHEAFR